MHQSDVDRMANSLGPDQTAPLGAFKSSLIWVCTVCLNTKDHYSSKMSRLMTKPTIWPVGPVKTQISLGIHPVCSKSLQCAQWVAKDPSFLHADSEDSDQTGQMPRLI